MNHKEIQNEIGSDFEKIISSSTLHRLMHEYSKQRKKLKIKKEDDYPIWREFKTKSKNTWLTRISKKRISPKYISTEDCETVCFTYYYSSIGLRVFYRTQNGVISVFNGHLFSRYRERMNLSITEPLSLVKKFFTINRDFNYMILAREKGERKIVGIVKEGFLLGEVIEETGWFIHKTFIDRKTTNFRLKSSEAEFTDALKDSLQTLDPDEDKELHEEMIRLYQNLGFMKNNDFRKNLGSAISSLEEKCLDIDLPEKNFLIIT